MSIKKTAEERRLTARAREKRYQERHKAEIAEKRRAYFSAYGKTKWAKFKNGPKAEYEAYRAARKPVEKRFRDADPQRQVTYKRKNHLKTYGLTQEQYAAMFAAQSGLCAICQRPEMVRGAHLGVDHCHITGIVRGLLCRRCNAGIGFLDDDRERVLAALAYLDEALEHYTPWSR